MNTQKHNAEVEKKNLTITDDLRDVRSMMEIPFFPHAIGAEPAARVGMVAERAALYIAHLRGRLDNETICASADCTGQDTQTVTKWSHDNSITIEVDADDEGMLAESVSIHDVIHWVGDNAPSMVWKAFSRLAAFGMGLCFNTTKADMPFSVSEVGLYSVRHCEGKTELLRVWIVPTNKGEGKSHDITAPVGYDGQVDETWLIARVRERFVSMRREAKDARRQADRTETAINAFASSIEEAAKSRPENAPF
jgi:hypothetical protein